MSKLSYRLSVKILAVAALGAVGFLDIAPAQAGAASADLGVSASVGANCTIAAAPINFGTYDAVSFNATQPLDGAGSVTVQCTSGAAASIMLGQGASPDAGSSDDAPLRRLDNGAGDHLSYGLYTDAAHSSAWGNTAQTSLAHTGTGLAAQIPVFGRVPGGQNVPNGAYTDTVLATVNF